MEDLNNSYLLLNYNFKCIIKSTAEANVVGVFGVFFFFFTKGSTQVFFFTNHQYVQGTFICKIVSETP